MKITYTRCSIKMYTLFLFRGEEKKGGRVSSGMEIVPVLHCSDKTRASLVENLGLSIKSTSPSAWRVVSALKE